MGWYTCTCGFTTDSLGLSARHWDGSDEHEITGPPIKCISEVLPEDFNRDGHCSTVRYREFEQRALEWLQQNGWKIIQPFVTTDGDSFGPLVRMCQAVDPDGVRIDLAHG